MTGLPTCSLTYLRRLPKVLASVASASNGCLVRRISRLLRHSAGLSPASEMSWLNVLTCQKYITLKADLCQWHLACSRNTFYLGVQDAHRQSIRMIYIYGSVFCPTRFSKSLYFEWVGTHSFFVKVMNRVGRLSVKVQKILILQQCSYIICNFAKGVYPLVRIKMFDSSGVSPTHFR